jgi:hypothetical protein
MCHACEQRADPPEHVNVCPSTTVIRTRAKASPSINPIHRIVVTTKIRQASDAREECL